MVAAAVAALLCALFLTREAHAQLPWEPGCTEFPCPCMSAWPDGTCQQCSDAAVMFNGTTCVWCTDQLCAVCGPTPNACQECVPFESQVDWGVEVDHPVYKDAATGRCTVCTAHPRLSGCYECDGRGRCTRCEAGFALINGACQPCKGGEACADCRPDTRECTACLEGFGFASPGNRTCVPCVAEGCGVCQQDHRTCTECSNPFMYLSRSNTCELCAQSYCDACDRDGQCVECSRTDMSDTGGYTLVGKACKPCGVADCDHCVPGRPGICTECVDGYFPADGGRGCAKCGNDCNKCKDARTCTECNFLSLVGGHCTRCQDPRCADCSGNAAVCRRCRSDSYRPHPVTGRCRLPPQYQQPPNTRVGGRDGRGTRHLLAAAAPQNLTAEVTAFQSAQPRPAIIGGQAAQRGRYPWMAQLRVNHRHMLFPQFCGASLVHPQVLLTAAHCLVDNSEGGRWQALAMALPQVRIGGHELNNGTFQQRHAKWAVVHPGYRPGRNDNDFALLLLDQPAAAGTPLARLPPAAPRPAAAPGARLTAIGWGYVDTEETEPTVLMEVSLPMQPLARCRVSYPDQPWQAQFCAGDPASTDTCQGDSGGPIFLKGANATQDMLVGVTSWGRGCAEGYPGVYADAAYARDWIVASIRWLVSQEAADLFPPAVPST